MVGALRDYLRDKTTFEKGLYALLVAAIMVECAVIALARPDEPATTQAPPVRSEGESRSGSTFAAPASTATAPACVDLQIPPDPPEPVTCRSRTATLTLVRQEDPVLLGDTHVRLLRARLRDSTLFVRLRVRNETDAEQSVGVGGQEIYMHVAGVRVDPRRLGDLRVAPGSGATADVIFNVPAQQRAAIQSAGGRFELGVTPWTADPSGERVVGVIRARLQ